jgi:hypothetical protein
MVRDPMKLRKSPVQRKGKILFTIGIARSGKSTFCTRWAQFFEEATGEFFPRAVVCSDDIRIALHGDRFNRHSEPMVWAINTYMTKALLLKSDVLIDGTNTTEDSLWRILNIDPDADYRLIHADPEECKRRARGCGHDDLVTKGVIDRQYAQLCKLQEEGVWQVVDRIRRRVKERWPTS